MLTNSFDLLLPFILFLESFQLLAFWSNDKHLLDGFFQQIFSYYSDPFNIIRLGITPENDSEAIIALSKYGYSSNIFFNISGEFLVTVAFGVICLIIKAITVFMNSECSRFITSKFRPLWNGYIFSIMPRLILFTGLQIRNVSDSRIEDIINLIIAAVILVLMIVHFVFMILQVRKIITRVEYLDETRL